MPENRLRAGGPARVEIDLTDGAAAVHRAAVAPRRAPAGRTGHAGPGVGAPEDRQLARRLVGGDERALGEVYERYGGAAFGLAMRVCGGDRAVAEDVVQEAFLALWRSPQAYVAERGSLSSYLLGTVHHRAVDAVRREESIHRRERTVARDEHLAPENEPDDAAWASIRRDRVRTALRLLSSVQREAIVLAYFGGFSAREVAERLGIPLGTAKTRIRDAMVKLRALLSAEVDDVR